jgi:ribosome biogenesis GTPase
MREDKGSYTLATENGYLRAELSGRLLYSAEDRSSLPVTGDFVVCVPADDTLGIIHAVLPRSTVLARKSAGRTTEEQILAANADIAVIAMPISEKMNLRKAERFFLLAESSGVRPVFVLTKLDLAENPDAAVSIMQSTFHDAAVVAVSSVDGSGLDALRELLVPGSTVVCIGASGAGKSTLINALAGERILETGEVREEDGRGRHTTTRREIIVTKDNVFLMDSPGIRELALCIDDDDLDRGFDDISALAQQCRFGDCRHESEPGCAVLGAVQNGSLDMSRLEAYWKIGKELEYLRRREDPSARAEEKRKWKVIIKSMRTGKKRNPDVE